MGQFYFGPGAAQRFGVYQPPLVAADRDLGVVICNPFGSEYLRTHRALRQLGLRLAQAGCYVLRFDYRGTGDSSGSGLDVDLADWRADVELAIETLKNMAGVSRVCLVGMRLGATLALLAARSRHDVESLVLWEPVVNGQSYLDDIWSMHEKWLEQRPWAASRHTKRDDDLWDVLGFPVSSRFRGQIAELSLGPLRNRLAHRALVVSAPTAGPPPALLLREIATVVEEEGSLPGIWREEGGAQGLVPTATLSAIVNWVSAAA